MVTHLSSCGYPSFFKQQIYPWILKLHGHPWFLKYTYFDLCIKNFLLAPFVYIFLFCVLMYYWLSNNLFLDLPGICMKWELRRLKNYDIFE